MADSIENDIAQLLETQALQVQADDLGGAVRVLDTQALQNLVSGLVAKAQADSGGGGGIDASMLAPFMEFDGAEGQSTLEEIDAELSSLETALNDLGDMESHFDFVTRVAEMRSDFNYIREDLLTAVGNHQAVLPRVQSGGPVPVQTAMEIVVAATVGHSRESEALVLKKSVDFMSKMLHLD